MNSLKKTVFTLLLSVVGTSLVWAESRCSETPKTLLSPGTVSCTYKKMSYKVGDLGLATRTVFYEVPIGTPPQGGWPVAVIFQGSLLGAALTNFTYNTLMPFGGFNEGKLIQKLLNSGYAVVYPSAATVPVVKDSPFTLFWDTNLPPYIISPAYYEKSKDFAYISSILSDVEKGKFGPLNANKKFATGISSGGYNTSRMAISFPGEFKALAIQSGSYATCSGPICVIPSTLPKDHPPTYILQGYLDPVVPWLTAQKYYDTLLSNNISTEFYTENIGLHAWFKSSPDRIVNWFNKYK